MAGLATDDEPDWDTLATSVYRYCLAAGTHQAEAEDLAQETTFRVWKRWSEGFPFVEIEGWAIVTARSVMRRRARDQETHRRIEEQFLHRRDLHVVRPDDIPTRWAIRDALARLPERDRELIGMHFYADLEYEQIARLMDRPPGTVRWWAMEALKKLARLLDEGVESAGEGNRP